MSKKPTHEPDAKRVAAPRRQSAQTSKTSTRKGSGTDVAREAAALVLDIGGAELVEDGLADLVAGYDGGDHGAASLRRLLWGTGAFWVDGFKPVRPERRFCSDPRWLFDREERVSRVIL